MTDADAPKNVQAAEQLVYASLLERGTRLGLAVLVVSFALYLMGWIEPRVPLGQLPALWSLPVESFLRETGAPTGWSWLRFVHRSDVASMFGIVILCGVSIVALAKLVALYRQRGDGVFAALCAVEIAIIVFAASGVLGFVA